MIRAKQNTFGVRKTTSDFPTPPEPEPGPIQPRKNGEGYGRVAGLFAAVTSIGNLLFCSLSRPRLPASQTGLLYGPTHNQIAQIETNTLFQKTSVIDKKTYWRIDRNLGRSPETSRL